MVSIKVSWYYSLLQSLIQGSIPCFCSEDFLVRVLKVYNVKKKKKHFNLKMQELNTNMFES